jgi:hypothetical protein
MTSSINPLNRYTIFGVIIASKETLSNQTLLVLAMAYFILFFNGQALFFFFFLTCPRKGRGRGIQTCDLHFIRRGSQLIELPLEDPSSLF